jgi:hypothetical protein
MPENDEVKPQVNNLACTPLLGGDTGMMRRWLVTGLFLIVQGSLVSPIRNVSVAAIAAADQLDPKGQTLGDPAFTLLRTMTPTSQAAVISNLELRRDAAVFKFDQGTFYFLTPVMNRVVGAVFLGEGSIHMQPPVEAERHFLKNLTGAPEIREPFGQAIFYFTDDTFDLLKKQIKISDSQLPSGVSDKFKDHQQTLRRELKETIELRILSDLYNPSRPGFFTAYFKGKNLSKLIFGVDPLGFQPSLPSPEEVGLASFDESTAGVWSLFHRQDEITSGKASSDEDHREYDISDYKIETTIGRNERLTAKAEVTFQPLSSGLRVIRFALYPRLRVGRVTNERREALPFIQTDHEEGGAFAVVFPQPLAERQAIKVTIEYSGPEVIRESGPGNFALIPEARSTWYPNNWQMDFGDRAMYDMTFLVPRGHTIIGSGKLVRSGQEGGYEVSRWVTEFPTAVAGFNYGQFLVRRRDDDGFKIEVATNTREPDEIRDIQNIARQLEQRGIILGPLGNLSTAGLAESALIEALNSIRIYNEYFGQNPYGRIVISQQPEAFFGQAWPMLVYLPYTAFFDGTQRRALGLGLGFSEFTDVVGPHEVAHQWWGHIVAWKTYRDQWLSEGFAEFSASLYLQLAYHSDADKRMKRFLEFWRSERELIIDKALLGVNRNHLSPNSVGPISLGTRLNTAKTLGAYQRLVYPKGAFIVHMLRMMLNNPRAAAGHADDRFIAMMKEFVSTYAHKAASTEDFKRIAEKHITPEMDLDGNGRLDWFFNEWVDGTYLPHYKLEYKVEPTNDGKFSLWLKATQSNVSESFKMLVPIYLKYSKGRRIRLGAATLIGNSSTETTVKLAEAPERVLMNAFEDVLCTKEETKIK